MQGFILILRNRISLSRSSNLVTPRPKARDSLAANRRESAAAHLPLPDRFPFNKAGFARVLYWLESLNSTSQIGLAIAAIVLIWTADVFTGPELSLSIFYALPIVMMGWLRGAKAARVTAWVGGGAWLIADYLAGHQYVVPAAMYWNALVRTGLFIVVGIIVNELRRSLESEQHFARTDSLTGAANSRYFMEACEREVARQIRYPHPLSIAFLDCDNFKQVNDRLGHAAGDQLLRQVAEELRSCLRKVDLVARLGGDEFAFLLPETNAVAAAQVSTKLRDSLTRAGAQYGVTFSLGLVTYLRPPEHAEELIKAADVAMYEAKHGGKDNWRHRVIGERPRQQQSVGSTIDGR